MCEDSFKIFVDTYNAYDLINIFYAERENILRHPRASYVLNKAFPLKILRFSTLSFSFVSYPSREKALNRCRAPCKSCLEHGSCACRGRISLRKTRFGFAR